MQVSRQYRDGTGYFSSVTRKVRFILRNTCINDRFGPYRTSNVEDKSVLKNFHVKGFQKPQNGEEHEKKVEVENYWFNTMISIYTDAVHIYKFYEFFFVKDIMNQLIRNELRQTNKKFTDQ